MRALAWADNRVKIIDQTLLPCVLRYAHIKTIGGMYQAVKAMKIRGAPALGAAAAYGIYLGVRYSRSKDVSVFMREVDAAAKYIVSCRPTAKNMAWAASRMVEVARQNISKPVSAIKHRLLTEAGRIVSLDRLSCASIGAYGQRLLKANTNILTICNTGMLATLGQGTALGVIRAALKEGKKIKVYACETRPMLQGARLTAWELKRMRADFELICDSMAASLMQKGMISAVIVGADRITRNGDTANKVGTYSLAALSKFHRVPFYVAAPASTFDLGIERGQDVPIEQRPAQEVTGLYFRKPIAPAHTKVYNPAFDVTPARLIDALITDKGIIKPPYMKNIPKTLGKKDRI